MLLRKVQRGNTFMVLFCSDQKTPQRSGPASRCSRSQLFVQNRAKCRFCCHWTQPVILKFHISQWLYKTPQSIQLGCKIIQSTPLRWTSNHGCYTTIKKCVLDQWLTEERIHFERQCFNIPMTFKFHNVKSRVLLLFQHLARDKTLWADTALPTSASNSQAAMFTFCYRNVFSIVGKRRGLHVKKN